MKRIDHQLAHSTIFVVAVAVLVAFIVFASAGLSSAAPRKSGPMMMGTKAVSGDRVEARIAYLHAKLNITPEQEELWKNVAEVMLDNAKTMEELIKSRSENAATMTPVDDLKSYSAIADAHADGLQKFIPVFESLYDTMSDAQKINADKLFRQHSPMKSKAKAKAKAKAK